MTKQFEPPTTIAIRSPRAIAAVAEEFQPDVDRTFTKAAEALIADGKKYRELAARGPRRRRAKVA